MSNTRCNECYKSLIITKACINCINNRLQKEDDNRKRSLILAHRQSRRLAFS